MDFRILNFNFVIELLNILEMKMLNCIWFGLRFIVGVIYSGIIYLKQEYFEFYFKLHKKYPNSKLLYHFPTKSLILAKEEKMLPRSMPLLIKDLNKIEIIGKKEKFLVSLV